LKFLIIGRRSARPDKAAMLNENQKLFLKILRLMTLGFAAASVPVVLITYGLGQEQLIPLAGVLVAVTSVLVWTLVGLYACLCARRFGLIPSDLAPAAPRPYWKDRCLLVLAALAAIVMLLVYVAAAKLYLAAVSWLLIDLMGVPDGPLWPSE
jgi:hypothetical protein